VTTETSSIELLVQMRSCSPERLCSEVARIFGVKTTEVGLLRVQGSYLKFVFPYELKTLGAIPLASSAVAAKTAASKGCEAFNNFVQVKHASIFEMVKLGTRNEETAMDGQTIQKLMSAAIVDASGQVLGVIQVSRKGATKNVAGPDFTEADLMTLREILPAVANIMPKLREL